MRKLLAIVMLVSSLTGVSACQKGACTCPPTNSNPSCGGC